MAAKTKLSKGILEMKFMKRTKDKVTQEQEDAAGRAMYASEITDRMLRHGGDSPYICEPSFVPCEGLVEGRFSYRGMNPEIERLLELEELAKQAANGGGRQEVQKDVADEEMADHYYGNVAKTMAKAFNRKQSGHHASHHHQQQNNAGGFRRKLNQPPGAQHQQNQKPQHQRFGNGGGGPPSKKPRFLKPQQD